MTEVKDTNINVIIKMTTLFGRRLGRPQPPGPRGRGAIPTPIENHANGDTYENLSFLDIDPPRRYNFFIGEGDMIIELARESARIGEKRIPRA